ncbi:MAG: histidine kinase [Provencibacterium sp.]|nr:histidine kinase [Provencibacterium sp.]
MPGFKNLHSLRKILAVLLAVLVPVAAGGVIFILYAIKNTQEKELDALHASIEAQTEQAGRSLSRMNNYLVDILLNNPYVEQIRQAQTVNAHNVAARALLSQFDYDATIWGINHSFALYVPDQKLTASRFNHAFPYADNLALRELFRAQAENGGVGTTGLVWKGVVQNGSVYLCKIYHANGVFLAAWISCGALFSDIQTNSLSPDAAIAYLLPEQPLPEEARGDSGSVRMEFETKYAEVRIVVTDVPYLNWGSISLLVFFVLFIFFVILLVAMYTLWYYHRHIQQPLNEFIHHVGEYAEQRQAVKRAGIRELNEAVEAFDTLSEEIQKLRIDLYEEKLTLAQTELEYYQLQIKPHFFVNCFALLHAMAQKKEYQRIQIFCIKLSSYVRYLFSESLGLVPLNRELSVVHDFLDIQRIRYRAETVLREEIDVTPAELNIPPLSLLTFVENALKHGGTENIGIAIRAEIVSQPQGQRLRLFIQDTGVGFPSELL